MANVISKTVNINDLPVEIDINPSDHIIVQNELKTYRVQFKDVIFNKENTTFGQEINELYVRVNELNTLVVQLQQSIATETARANAAEAALRSLVSTTKTELQNKQATEINAEKSRAISRESMIEAQLKHVRTEVQNETNRAKSQEASLRREIDRYH